MLISLSREYHKTGAQSIIDLARLWLGKGHGRLCETGCNILVIVKVSEPCIRVALEIRSVLL